MNTPGASKPHSPRRRRYDRPWSLWVFGLALLVSPIVNFIAIARHYGLAITSIGEALSKVSPISAALLIVPIPIAIGILFIQRWAWWMFLIYASALILHNLYALAVNASTFNTQALGGAAFGTAAMIYFLRRDVFAPFLHTGKRGWRRANRKSVVLDILVNGTPLRSRDISLTGVFVEWDDCPHALNTGVNVVLQFPSGAIELNAGIVHVSAKGAGIAFRGVSNEARARLKQALDQA